MVPHSTISSRIPLLFLEAVPQTVLAYAAGIIDGEGCIRIACGRIKPGRTNVNTPYRLTVFVTNTNPAMIQYLHQHFGGFVGKGNKARGNFRSTVRWTIADRGAEQFLRLIEPYIVCKKEEIQLAYVFRASFNRANWWCGNGLSVGVLELRDHCYQQMKALHHLIYE